MSDVNYKLKNKLNFFKEIDHEINSDINTNLISNELYYESGSTKSIDYGTENKGNLKKQNIYIQDHNVVPKEDQFGKNMSKSSFKPYTQPKKDMRSKSKNNPRNIIKNNSENYKNKSINANHVENQNPQSISQLYNFQGRVYDYKDSSYVDNLNAVNPRYRSKSRNKSDVSFDNNAYHTSINNRRDKSTNKSFDRKSNRSFSNVSENRSKNKDYYRADFTFTPSININSRVIAEKLALEKKRKPLVRENKPSNTIEEIGVYKNTSCRNKHQNKTDIDKIICQKIENINKSSTLSYFIDLNNKKRIEGERGKTPEKGNKYYVTGSLNLDNEDIKAEKNESINNQSKEDRCLKLYTLAASKRKIREEKIEKSQNEKLNHEKSAATFQPRLNIHSREIVNNIRTKSRSKSKDYDKESSKISESIFLDNMRTFNMKKTNKIDNIKFTLQDRFEEIHTFRPNLTKTELKEDENIIKGNLERINQYVKRRQKSIHEQREKSKDKPSRLKIPDSKQIIENFSQVEIQKRKVDPYYRQFNEQIGKKANSMSIININNTINNSQNQIFLNNPSHERSKSRNRDRKNSREFITNSRINYKTNTYFKSTHSRDSSHGNSKTNNTTNIRAQMNDDIMSSYQLEDDRSGTLNQDSYEYNNSKQYAGSNQKYKYERTKTKLMDAINNLKAVSKAIPFSSE